MSDDWKSFVSIWLLLAHTTAQHGRPVVLFGTQLPDAWESPPQRRYVGPIHYLALVCEDDVLAARLRARPPWRNSGKPEFIADMLGYNRWLKENASKTEPPMELLDTTRIDVVATTKAISGWVKGRLGEWSSPA